VVTLACGRWQGSITVTCEVDAASVSEANLLSTRLTSGLVENLKNKVLQGLG
jgi:hypothetical protein